MILKPFFRGSWLMLVLTVTVRAQVSALSFGSVGSSSYLDSSNRLLGWQFTVTQPTDVLALGWFDLGGDGLATSHAVGIWDVGSPLSPIASATVQSATGSTLVGNFRFETLGSPVTLQVGTTYRVAGFDPGNGDPHVWDVVLAGFENKEVIAFNHDARISLIAGGAMGPFAAGFDMPTSFTGDGRSVLMGPNLLLATVPEPATSAAFMALMAVAGVLWRCRAGSRGGIDAHRNRVLTNRQG